MPLRDHESSRGACAVCKKPDSFTSRQQEQQEPSLLLTVLSSLWESEFSILLRDWFSPDDRLEPCGHKALVSAMFHELLAIILKVREPAALASQEQDRKDNFSLVNLSGLVVTGSMRERWHKS